MTASLTILRDWVEHPVPRSLEAVAQWLRENPGPEKKPKGDANAPNLIFFASPSENASGWGHPKFSEDKGFDLGSTDGAFFDLDGEAATEAAMSKSLIAMAAAGIGGVYSRSHNATPEDPNRGHLQIVFDSPCPAELHSKVWKQLHRELFPEVLKTQFAPNRGRNAPKPGAHVQVIEGGLVNWRAVLERAPKEEPPPPTPVIDLETTGDRLKRALAYEPHIPPSVAGSGGDDALYRAACECKRFGLDPEHEAIVVMRQFNDRCQPRWPESRLRYKIKSAYASGAVVFGEKLTERESIRPRRERARNPGPPPAQDWSADEYAELFGEETKPAAAAPPATKRDETPRSEKRPSKPKASPARVSDLAIGSDLEVAGLILEQELSGAVFSEGKLWKVDASHVWQEVDPGDVFKMSQRFDGATYPSGDRIQVYRINAAKQQSIYVTLCNSVADPKFFADSARGVAFADKLVTEKGVVDLTNDHRVRFAYPFPYNPNARPAMFQKFLEDCFAGTDDAQQRADSLCEFVGVCLFGAATRFQKAYMLMGIGANGKSQLLDLVRASMPTGSVTSISPSQMSDEKHLVALPGKLLNIVPEIEESAVVRSGSVKGCIAGDVQKPRGAYAKLPTEFSPIAGHIWAINGQLRSDDRSHGFWRRWVAIRFPNVFEKGGAKHVVDIWRVIHAAEHHELVSWFVAHGLRALARDALTVPSSSEVELQKWRTGTDQVAEFAEDMIEPAPAETRQGEWMPVADLYSHYVAWCQATGHKGVLARRKLIESLCGMRLGYRDVKQAGKQRINAVLRADAETTRSSSYGRAAGWN